MTEQPIDQQYKKKFYFVFTLFLYQFNNEINNLLTLPLFIIFFVYCLFTYDLK